jgi:hypothetical protein
MPQELKWREEPRAREALDVSKGLSVAFDVVDQTAIDRGSSLRSGTGGGVVLEHAEVIETRLECRLPGLKPLDR